MAKGRKNIPDSIKVLKGTNQPCRIKGNSFEFEKMKKLPPVPRWVCKTGKKQFKDTAKNLFDLGLINEQTIGPYLAYCQEIGLYYETHDQISIIDKMLKSIDCDFNKELNNVDIIDDKNKLIEQLNDWQSPYMKRIKELKKQASEHFKNFTRMAVEFGLTPSSASKLILPKKQDDNPLNEFIK
jgi:P27 family predicted phage terminase small subunit